MSGSNNAAEEEVQELQAFFFTTMTSAGITSDGIRDRTLRNSVSQTIDAVVQRVGELIRAGYLPHPWLPEDQSGDRSIEKSKGALKSVEAAFISHRFRMMEKNRMPRLQLLHALRTRCSDTNRSLVDWAVESRDPRLHKAAEDINLADFDNHSGIDTIIPGAEAEAILGDFIMPPSPLDFIKEKRYESKAFDEVGSMLVKALGRNLRGDITPGVDDDNLGIGQTCHPTSGSTEI